MFVTRARRVVEPEEYFDEDEVSLLLTKNAAVLCANAPISSRPTSPRRSSPARYARIWTSPPQASGIARMLFSLFSTPSPTLDMDDDAVVADFVRAHVVRGFAPDRPGRAR